MDKEAEARGEGGGGQEGKTLLVTRSLFSFSLGLFPLFRTRTRKS